MEPFVELGLQVVTDSYKVQPVKSFIGQKGLWPQVVSLQGKEQMRAYIAVNTRLQDGSLRIWRHPALLEDLRRVQMRDAETVHLPRYGGSHCDTAAALINACWLLRDADGSVEGEPIVGVSPWRAYDRALDEWQVPGQTIASGLMDMPL
jgi:hypothetical protein